MTQKQVILDIVRTRGPLRTEDVERYALQNYISGGSAGRYLRWLAEDKDKEYPPKIIGKKVEGSKTKIWRVKREPEQMGIF